MSRKETAEVKRKLRNLQDAVTDILDGTLIDQYNRDDDGMNDALSLGAVSLASVRKWRSKMRMARDISLMEGSDG